MVTKKKAVKKENKEKQSRKEYLREHLIEHLAEVQPEFERKFNIYTVCEARHSRGSFRDYMEGDFYPVDIKLFKEICQDLKKEGKLVHVGGQGWARLE